MSGLEVIVKDLKGNPCCPHGPTLLFSRKVNGVKRNFFACSACRDRKLCSFFLYEDQKSKHKSEAWNEEKRRFLKGINHRKLFVTLNQVKQTAPNERLYCHTCSGFQLRKFWDKHADHKIVKNVLDYQLTHPSEFLPPLEDPKKEAQFLFAQSSVKTLINIFKELNYKNIVSMGTPRIHEFVANECPEMNSLLMDLDDRYHSFYGPLEFCWYNSFNHHFFLPESEEIFLNFLNNRDLVLVLDPPFGGRVEPLAHTIKQINTKYKELTANKSDLSVFWIFPYFMEPQIVNSLPDFVMLDYKVDYDNHPLFQDGAKARKFGSPVRIFTNVDPKKITLPAGEGYKFCERCEKWVSNENQHCEICDFCTSKDGRTYVHCTRCQRCVKPSWQHCDKCERCAQPDHKCGEFEFTQGIPNLKECFNCKKSGHKKRDCPEVNRMDLHQKRKLKVEKQKSKKKLKTV